MPSPRALGLALPLALAATLLASGCARQEPVPDTTTGTVAGAGMGQGTDGMSSLPRGTGETTTTTTTTTGNGPYGANGAGGADGMNASAPAAGGNVIYFGYDVDALDGEGQAKADAYGMYMMQPTNAGMTVRVEGNTDERGSPEYNIALGERRAVAVSRALMAQGVAKARLRVVTYGATRPAVPGHDEDAWAKNRRVEIHPAR